MQRKVVLVLAALLLCAFDRAPPTPADLYGPLFEAVQLGRLFKDGKTFVDAVPKRAPQAILEDYRRTAPSGEALRAFVEANFQLPPETAVPSPQNKDRRPLLRHIAALWPHLKRPPLTPPPGSSALGLPAPYVVPGGRFREIYYWDSYFTMLGLVQDGQDALVDSMLADFESLIERFGHIPNGTRSYYLSRSQPPFFTYMLDLVGEADPATERRRVAALQREHAFWMAGAGCLDASGACARVVRMPDGSLLNRYWDDRATPRDESYAEDVATASASGRPKEQVYRDLRAAAESGWDFSARWLADPQSLASIRTTGIVPVDLNSLLWALERAISRRCVFLADVVCVREYEGRATARQAAILRYLWVPGEGRFGDWDRGSGAVTPVVSAATLYPLFVDLATPEQADAVAALTARLLVAPGGLRTTLLRTGQQWDSPNGWPPLQWVGVIGLSRYGHEALARDIAGRWIGTVEQAYRDTGKLLEKYNVEDRLPGGGGEYPLQDGFGWTNGVTRALIARYPDLHRH
ncbi:alpha,alpha-trehalase TreF [Azospirillum thermophilum]|uniref:Trehalase n=1 Tax=Azospirillum thermophilum TaxID=2202148 RepID=A0A2S2CMZ8_9PROT|nr:alpha,alpha-trehalase TreF [Azospirillum thermophilum]AWK85904.1 trehalase [Azospirillum thermophilum]